MNKCKHEFEKVEAIEDYNDPANPYGHGQHTKEILECIHCGYTEEREFCEVEYIL